ncbi:uncharacterized protein LOC112457065 [Temnothorax curvispinosus]|uniref:Uncharacterized protein LOC112457065 n=1 Tax=Temnothorax curvispinosus TaxID=300111 RepID=A0A6J1Q451_9HYME|nr:uncharacterized protein LOC112457065 [Temnothorax curvispinosus]
MTIIDSLLKCAAQCDVRLEKSLIGWVRKYAQEHTLVFLPCDILVPVKWMIMAATMVDTMVQSNGFQTKKKEDIENKDNLWSSILAEVQNSGNNKLPSNKNVLVLGKILGTGPRSLDVARILSSYSVA